MAIRWTHITVKVSDLGRAIEFYSGVCGLAVLRDRRLEGGGTVWLGPPQTAAGRHPAFVLVLSEGEVEAKLDHFGFQCDTRAEVDQIARTAERNGTLVYPPQDAGGSVGYWTMLRDPDGHLVEFTHGQPLTGLS